MSYIDTFNHSEVGSFLGITLYHPLEKLDEEVDYADESCLVLGGGGDHWGGEHPSMKIEKLDVYVAMYIEFRLDLQMEVLEESLATKTESNQSLNQAEKDKRTIEASKNRIEQLFKHFDANAIDQAFLFNPSLGMDESARLTKAIKKAFKPCKSYDPNLPKIFEKKFGSYSTEIKFCIMMGEVIYMYCKRLLKPETHAAVKDLNIIAGYPEETPRFYQLFDKNFVLALPETGHYGNVFTWKDEAKNSSKWNPICFYKEEETLKKLGDNIIWRDRNVDKSA